MFPLPPAPLPVPEGFIPGTGEALAAHMLQTFAIQQAEKEKRFKLTKRGKKRIAVAKIQALVRGWLLRKNRHGKPLVVSVPTDAPKNVRERKCMQLYNFILNMLLNAVGASSRLHPHEYFSTKPDILQLMDKSAVTSDVTSPSITNEQRFQEISTWAWDLAGRYQKIQQLGERFAPLIAQARVLEADVSTEWMRRDRCSKIALEAEAFKFDVEDTLRRSLSTLLADVGTVGYREVAERINALPILSVDWLHRSTKWLNLSERFVELAQHKKENKFRDNIKRDQLGKPVCPSPDIYSERGKKHFAKWVKRQAREAGMHEVAKKTSTAIAWYYSQDSLGLAGVGPAAHQSYASGGGRSAEDQDEDTDEES